MKPTGGIGGGPGTGAGTGGIGRAAAAILKYLPASYSSTCCWCVRQPSAGPKDTRQHQSGRGLGVDFPLVFRPLDPGRTGVGVYPEVPHLRGSDTTTSSTDCNTTHPEQAKKYRAVLARAFVLGRGDDHKQAAPEHQVVA